jgi:hypothetical protein
MGESKEATGQGYKNETWARKDSKGVATRELNATDNVENWFLGHK